MDRLLENGIVFTNLNGTNIIKCECLDILKYCSEYPIYNIDFAYYRCDKVRIIEVYDINKNIINCIFDPIYNNPLVIGSIISLESFKKNACLKKNYYFKTFFGAFINKNKINGIKYNVIFTGKIIGFKNNNVNFNCFDDFLKFDEFYYLIHFYNNNKTTNCINNNCDYFNIKYYLYDNFYNYEIKIYRNGIIKIEKSYKTLSNIFHVQIIICNKELKILQILEQEWDHVLYEENRDINDVVIDIKKYNIYTNKLETILSKKSEKNFPQELLDFYNSKINFLCNLISIKNDELSNAKETLLKNFK